MMIGLQELTRKQIYILSAALSAVLLIAVVATFRSCRPHTYPAELVAADSLCDSNADSAAVVLSRLERSGGYDGADRMYLDLLKVKLANNLYEPQKDSTIFRVVDYFEDMGDRERLCQAYYYQGKYYKEHNDAPQALKGFQQSLKSADKDTPLSFYSKLYNQSGKIFMAQDLYDDALAMYKESFVCDSVLNDTVNMVHSLRDISQVYKHFRMFDNSEQCLKRASDILNGGCSSDIRDGLQESIQLCLAQVYRDKGDIDMAHKIFSEDLNGDVPQLMSAKYSLAIDIYSNKGDFDSTYFYCRKVLESGTLYAKEHALEKLIGFGVNMLSLSDIDNYVRRYGLITDSIRSLNATESVAKIHALYNYSLREKENSELRQKNKETLYFIVFSALLFVSVVLFLFYLNEKNKKRYLEYRQLSEHLEHLYAMSSAESHEREKGYELRIKELETALGAASDGGAASPGDSARLGMARIYEILKSRIDERQNVSPDDWASIGELFDEVFPGFRTRLYSVSGMKMSEYRICMLVKLGLQNSEIATIVCRTPGAITHKRVSMYAKVFGKAGSAKEFDEYIKSL